MLTRRRTRVLAGLAGVLAVCSWSAACSSDPAEPSAGTANATASDESDASDADSSDESSSDESSSEESVSDDQVDAECGDRSIEPHGVESTPVQEIGTVDDITVRAAVYPLADTEGNPWSQWGQGVILSDGRYVSAVGDHLGVDGTSWFYEFDPETSELSRTTEVSEALDHAAGDWGYGKIHAPMLVDECDDIVTATYWGTRRDIEFGGSYSGDHLIRYDTATGEVTSLGVPVEGHGLPSLAMSPDRKWIFGEAVDPYSDPDAGAFFIADASTGEVAMVEHQADHVGFRRIMVDPDGNALYSAGEAGLWLADPIDASLTLLTDVLPGDWLRASTPVAPDGSVYGVTRDPDALFRLDDDGNFTDLGMLDDYVASVGMSPDGSTLYYVPDAHGGAWTQGTPLIAVDTATGDRTELVRLNDLIEAELGLRAGGTYSVVVDPSGERIYVGLNAGAIDDDEDPFGDVILAVVDL